MPYGGLAYFNHGPDSGKSQPHKHVQVVPLPLSREVDAPVPMQDVLDETLQGEPLGTPCEMLKLPYRAYACRIDPECALEPPARLSALPHATPPPPPFHPSDMPNRVGSSRCPRAAGLPHRPAVLSVRREPFM